MNIVFLLIILLTLFISTLIHMWVLKKKENKWLSVLVAFGTNTLILSISSILLYNLDVQTFHKQIDGILGSLGILVLIFFIPIVTLVNYFIVEIVRKKV